MTPSLDNAALFLDVDGTLLDIAPTPDSVIVPPGLLGSLRRVRDRLGGALAIVSGRPLHQLDALLPDTAYAVAAEHGGAIRFAPGAEVERPDLPKPPAEWRARAAAIAAAHPGAVLEEKAHGFVFHFRASPAHETALRAEAETLVAGDKRFAIMGARMAWEVKPLGADKGTAVRALMSLPPFAGHRPIFIGDDVTDEDGIRAARALGGEGIRLPDIFPDPDHVRAWLAASAQ